MSAMNRIYQRRGCQKPEQREDSTAICAVQKKIEKQVSGEQRKSRMVSLRDRNHNVSFRNGCFVLLESYPSVESTES